MLLAGLTACGSADRPAGRPDPAPANGSNPFAGLPGLPQDAPGTGAVRSTSAYQFLDTDLKKFFGATMTGAQLSIHQPGLCYAILGVDTGGMFPPSLTLSGTLHGLWIGVSDYAHGVWKWVGSPRETAGMINLPAAGTLSPGGKIYIALVCPPLPPGDQAWAEISVELQIDPLPDMWNLLVWIAGDNDLAQYAAANLNAMEQVGSTPGVRILAGYDIDPTQAPGITGLDRVWFIKVMQDSSANKIVTDGDPNNADFPRAGYNSADPAKLAQFIAWAKTNFPARRNALVLWDHGDGWLPGWKSGSSARRNWQRPRQASGILGDYADGDYNLTDNIAVAQALSGQHFDLLCFDACNMGQLEALYDFRGTADWISASEALVPATGYPYAQILSAWNAALPATAPEVAKIFADEMVAFYDGPEYACQATLDMGRLDALTVALHDVAVAVTAQAATESALVQQAISAAFQPELSDGERDLRGFLQGYRGLTANATIQAQLDAALLAYDDTFVTYFTQHALTGTSGVAAYLPSVPFFSAEYQDMYAPRAFNAATGWLAMLNATGVPEGSGEGVVVQWASGDRIELSWSDAGADIDLGLYDPLGNFGAPYQPGTPSFGVTFSPDSFDSGQALEWGKLKASAPAGAYYLGVGNNNTSGPPSAVTVKLYNNDGDLKQDLGVCSVAPKQYVDYATLEY